MLGRRLPVNKQLDLPAMTCDKAWCVGVYMCISCSDVVKNALSAFLFRGLT